MCRSVVLRCGDVSELLKLLQLPGARLRRVEQCNYGILAVKPTCFFDWKVPTSGRHLDELNIDVDMRSLRPLQGRIADGSLCTSIANAYPEICCKCIAHSFVHVAREHDNLGICSDIDLVNDDFKSAAIGFGCRLRGYWQTSAARFEGQSSGFQTTHSTLMLRR